MPGCERKKLTSWKEDKFTVRSMSGIKEREKRIKEILNKEIPKAKPGNWACDDDHAVYCSCQKQTSYTFRGYVLRRDVTKFQGYALLAV